MNEQDECQKGYDSMHAALSRCEHDYQPDGAGFRKCRHCGYTPSVPVSQYRDQSIRIFDAVSGLVDIPDSKKHDVIAAIRGVLGIPLEDAYGCDMVNDS